MTPAELEAHDAAARHAPPRAERGRAGRVLIRAFPGHQQEAGSAREREARESSSWMSTPGAAGYRVGNDLKRITTGEGLSVRAAASAA